MHGAHLEQPCRRVGLARIKLDSDHMRVDKSDQHEEEEEEGHMVRGIVGRRN